MYGAYYPYLYATSRAAPGRPFYHQYDRVSSFYPLCQFRVNNFKNTYLKQFDQ